MSSRSVSRRAPCAGALAFLALVAPSLGGVAPAAIAAPRAFPGAEGFGALVTGGRAAKVVHVSNLNDSGAGSLRDAISAGNRTVVFDVGGVITIGSQLVVAGDNVTIAGQTAPGSGVTVYGDGTSVSGRKNVIIRYLRFRQGIDSGDGTKALNVTDGANMIFDHLSVQWGRWDTIGLTGNTSSVTIQYSLLGESIDPQRFGGLVDSADKITLSHNLWMSSQSRSPKFKANGQYINNVVYNWGGNGLGGGHSGANWYEDIINNFFIKGPSSTGGFVTGYATTDRVFNSGNLVDLDRDGQLMGRAVVASDFQGDSPPTFETAAHNVPPVSVTVESASAAYASLVAQAGSSLCRDAVDQRLLGYVTSLGTKGAIVADEKAVGGQPSMPMVSRPAGFDKDGDGMPDTWEAAHGLKVDDASDGAADADGDGYTNLEDYLNALAGGAPDSCGAGGGQADGGAGSMDGGNGGANGGGPGADGAAAFDAPTDTSTVTSDGGVGADGREDPAAGRQDASGGGAEDARVDPTEGPQDANSTNTGGRVGTGNVGTGGAGVPTDGATGNGSAGASPDGSGCGCRVTGGSPAEPWCGALLLFALILVAPRGRPRRLR